MVVLLAGIVGGTQRLRAQRGAHPDKKDLGAPLPLETVHALDEMTAHEVEAEEREHEAERRDGSRATLSRDR